MLRIKLIAWVLLALMFFGCKSSKDAVTPTTVLLSGQVINRRTERGIPNARIATLEFNETATSDSSGVYQLEITTGDSFRGVLTVVASADGYSRDTTMMTVSSGRRIDMPRFTLDNLSDQPDTVSHGPSGPPATILFVGSDVPSIGVRETGIVETARLTYEVRDTRGVPVDLNNLATVKFRIDGSTGGGEYLGQDSAITNENGRVQVSIIAGIRPGTVQVVASVHDTIRARPVQMTIHTGPPDSTHTTIGFRRINFPALGWVARVDSVVSLVGDRYSNPVPSNTEVYFSSDNGVIGPRGNADRDGISLVPLFSGNPYPIARRGFSDVHLQTVDWRGISYTITGTVLWTGPIANFDIGWYDSLSQLHNGESFSIPNLGTLGFHIHLSDIFDHPLSGGTTVAVTSTYGGLNGEVNMLFPDTWSDAWTNFNFTVSDPDTANHIPPYPSVITVTVRGENGNAARAISGVIY